MQCSHGWMHVALHAPQPSTLSPAVRPIAHFVACLGRSFMYTKKITQKDGNFMDTTSNVLIFQPFLP